MIPVQGIKHLIKCNCILPHLKESKQPIFHSFVAFSVIDDEDKVIEKFASCNNCGITHRVYGICESEVLAKENSSAVINQKDISLLIPSELSNILNTYDCDTPTWEYAQFIVQNDKWGSAVTLTRIEKDGEVEGKRLVIVAKDKFKIEPYSFTEMA